MTDDQRRDRDVHAWILAEGMVPAPDRLRDAVRAEIVDTRQERGTATLPEWLAAMPMRAAAVFLVVVVGTAALGMLAGRGSVGVATPTSTPAVAPSPTSPPSASPSASPAPTPRGVALPPGSYATTRFRPGLRVTAEGWTLSVDQSDLLVLVRPGASSFTQPDGLTAFDGVNVYARPFAGQPDGTLAPMDGVGRSASELATWLSNRPQLTTTPMVEEQLAGRTAYRLDFQLSPQAGALCGIPCANLLNSSDDPQGGYAMGLEAAWKVRAWLLDAPDGSTVMVTIEAPEGASFDATVAAGTPVVRSITFATP